MKPHAPPQLTARSLILLAVLLAEAIPALAQSGGLPTPINPLTVTSPWRPAYLNGRFPIRNPMTNPNQPIQSICLWGYADRPAWQGSPGVGDHTNTGYYWLPREQPWFAFDRTNLTAINLNAMSPQIFRRATWSENVNFEYPLIGGRGIMTNLESSRTTILRWVRPLTYPGDLRRDAR